MTSTPENTFKRGVKFVESGENKERTRGEKEQEAGRWYGRAAGESECVRVNASAPPRRRECGSVIPAHIQGGGVTALHSQLSFVS